jgi:thiol-disulfide isomerase/thioredoxin
VLIRNKNGIEKPAKNFFERWEGVALAAEKSNFLQQGEARKYYKEERIQLRLLSTASVVLGLLIIIALLQRFTWQNALLLLTSLLGIATSFLIIQKESGRQNELADRFCKAGKTADCNAVLKAGITVLPGWLKISDAAIIYFITQLLVFSFSFGFGYEEPVLSVCLFIAAAAIPVTLLSMYYQWRIVKKWCTLCLLIIAVLWLQAVLLLPGIAAVAFTAAFIKTGAITACCFVLTGAAWLLLRNRLGRINKTEQELYSALRFKRNPEIFESLLEKQSIVDITPFESDFQLGNPEAPLQVMVACNLYCTPCAKAHKVLHRMMERHGGSMGLTIRFVVNAEDKADKNTQAVQYLLQYMAAGTNGTKEKNRELMRTTLHNWFELMDYEKFTARHPLTKRINVDGLLKEHEAWNKNANIKFTPAVFINGYEMPEGYSAADLPGLATGLIARAGEAGNTVTEKAYALI